MVHGGASAYRVARCDENIFVMVAGLASMANTPILDEFLKSEAELGVRRICVDLSACTGMDSTFMGSLVGHASRFGELGGSLLIINPGPDNARLLDMLGVSTIVPVVSEQAVPTLRYLELPPAEATALERAQLMREAHQNLIMLSDENRKKFTPFLQKLQAEIDRLG